MSNEMTVQQNGTRAAPAQPEATRGQCFTPRVDILETAEELLLLADLPGVRTEDLELHFEKGELLLHGKCPQRQPGAQFLLNEYGIGDFYRAFAISEEIDASRISAELKQGVLTVHLPKSDAVKPRKIQVKSE
jgi:HSP20 family molecular chaperone IbpA